MKTRLNKPEQESIPATSEERLFFLVIKENRCKREKVVALKITSASVEHKFVFVGL